MDEILFEPGAKIAAVSGTPAEHDALASIAISLKRIADALAGGTNKHAATINGGLVEISRNLVHVVAKL